MTWSITDPTVRRVWHGLIQSPSITLLACLEIAPCCDILGDHMTPLKQSSQLAFRIPNDSLQGGPTFIWRIADSSADAMVGLKPKQYGIQLQNIGCNNRPMPQAHTVDEITTLLPKLKDPVFLTLKLCWLQNCVANCRPITDFEIQIQHGPPQALITHQTGNVPLTFPEGYN